MRVIKAPLRISLFGGGCDLPEYYSEHGATIISFAINRHMHLVHSSRPTGGYRLSYSEIEELSSLTTAKHTIIRQAAIDYGEIELCTLSIVSDVPKGTGLGSSSSLAVCAYELFRKDRIVGDMPAHAYASYLLERKVSNCGVQDHLPATLGGFRIYHVDTSGRAKSQPLPQKVCQEIDNCGLLLYTGISRSADTILKTWKQSTSHLRRIDDLAKYVEMNIDALDASTIGKYLQVSWELKRVIGGVSDDKLDWQYRKAMDAGAFGGKLIGAGGGGCWFFLVDPAKRGAVKDALDLLEIPFRIEYMGMTQRYA